MDDCISLASGREHHCSWFQEDRGLYRRMGCTDAGLFSVIRLQRDSRPPWCPASARVD